MWMVSVHRRASFIVCLCVLWSFWTFAEWSIWAKTRQDTQGSSQVQVSHCDIVIFCRCFSTLEVILSGLESLSWTCFNNQRILTVTNQTRRKVTLLFLTSNVGQNLHLWKYLHSFHCMYIHIHTYIHSIVTKKSADKLTSHHALALTSKFY